MNMTIDPATSVEKIRRLYDGGATPGQEIIRPVVGTLIEEIDRLEERLEETATELGQAREEQAALEMIREAAEDLLPVYTVRRDSPKNFAADLCDVLRRVKAGVEDLLAMLDEHGKSR